MLFFKNTIFTPLYSALVTQQPLFIYYKGYKSTLIAVLFLLIICFISTNLIDIETWVNLITTFLLISLVYALFIHTFIMNENERSKLKSIIKNKFL